MSANPPSYGMPSGHDPYGSGPSHEQPPAGAANDLHGTVRSGGVSDPYGTGRPDSAAEPVIPAAGPVGGQAPTCPRHPDRPSFITCQRCRRPVCPECQRSAAVGVQCVDCVRDAESHAAATRPRTAVGANPVEGKPVVTYALMAVCGVLYALQMIGFDNALARLFMFAPYRALDVPWTFVTSGFLHGSLAHVALNMWALWAVGQYLERTLGHWRYTALFFLSVIGGHVAVLALATPATESWFTGTVGASGGVFGLFGALLVVQRRMGGEAMQVMVLIGLNMVISFMYPNISWQGHLGGLITGVALATLMFAFRPKAVPGADRAALARKSASWHAVLCAVALAVLVLIVVAKVFMVMAS